MQNNDIGYYEEPKNSGDIKRARTTKQIRSWEMPRSIKALEKLNNELEKVEFPSIYILLERNKTYVGEAKDIYKRLKTHINNPDDKIKKWDKVLVINDGRPSKLSDFNDPVVRKDLELHLINLLKANKYTVVSIGEKQILNARQRHSSDLLTQELDYVLLKKNIISKILEERGQEEVFRDELKKIIEKSGRRIQKWGGYEALIDGEKVFIRPGSKKPKGWQITFRGRKPGSLIDSFQKGNGYLLVPRNGVLLIPLTEVQKVIKDKSAYEQDTVDIWIEFAEDEVTLKYKKDTIKIGRFRLIK